MEGDDHGEEAYTADVISVFDGVIGATKAGDLDAQLATIKRSKKGGKEEGKRGSRW